MEAARTLLSPSPSFPPRNHLKNSLFSSSFSSSSSVLKSYEQAVPAVSSVPTTLLSRNFPTSVLLQEQRDEFRAVLNMVKEDRTSQATLDRTEMDIEASMHEGILAGDSDQLMLESGYQSLSSINIRNLMSLFQTAQIPSWSMPTQSVATDTDKLLRIEPINVIELAQKALSASKEAALLAQRSNDLNDTVSTSMGSLGSSGFSFEEVKTVKSNRRLERQSRVRRKGRTKEMSDELYYCRSEGVQKRTHEAFDPKDPLRLFLWGPETKQLLTAKEEFELIAQVQDIMRLEKVKKNLQSQFGREPTLVEWADAVGLSYTVLQSQLQSGNSSREKLITSNLRMVVHIAKQYQNRGLSLQDLLQEGSMGLMKSVEKFKPQVGCRFGTYAYWWIRHAVRKAIFQHSRTIRLPENMYHVLGKVMEAKRSCIQEGNQKPSSEEIAKRAGITVDKLQKLMYMARIPLSMQQPVWSDQDTTFQEITADSGIDVPEVSVGKQLMRRHVRGLLNNLNTREKQIIKLRFGIEDGNRKSLSEIGNAFGLCKERVRQLESRALFKLKKCLDTHGLEAYADLLV
ncbi:RNA polymerase sigma factor sigF, chloroplastic [Euphorbia lathyris]|uniref:RNA polymerase sigma factor sigF, chloroplastic n=1 Tax=Euphorbia lathyris TaxID=212925 RepID=UPI003313E1DB